MDHPQRHTSGTIPRVAEEAFAVLNSGRQIDPFSARYPGFGLDDAYHVTRPGLARVNTLEAAAG